MRRKKWAVPELMASPLYIQEPESFRGRWQAAFAKEQPLYVELGCGKGGFSAEFALQNPDINLLAVDISSNMLGVGRRKIDALFAENGRTPDNIRLTEYNIEHIHDAIAPEDDVQRIFINFCNPWPKPRHYKKRLTHPRQLTLYKTFLRPGCEIRFKTDDDLLFEHSREYFAENGFEILWETTDLANSGFEGNIKTEHEAMFEAEGIRIKMLIARFPGEQDGE